MFYIYDQVNDLASNVVDSTRFSDNRDALLHSVLNRAEAIIADYGITGTVAWTGQVNSNQGGAGLDGGAANNNRYSLMGVKKSTSYNWYGAGSSSHAMTVTAARAYGETTRWNGQANNNGIVPSLNVLCGYDHARWKALYTTDWTVTDWTYEQMKQHYQAANTYLTANVNANTEATAREVIICAWNEWGEGSALGPCGWNQHRFLDAFHEVFVSGVAMGNVLSPYDVYTSAGAWPGKMDHIHDWVQFPTAEPAFNPGDANTSQGITIPRGLYPAVEPAKVKQFQTWV